MNNYIKPSICIESGISEGIYMASGQLINCNSVYMNGIFQKPTYNPIRDGYKIGYGCDGCPACNGNSCKFISNPIEMTWIADFRPSWEKQGHLPDEKGY